MEIENLVLIVKHNKPYYPSKANVEKKIENAFNVGLSKFNEVSLIDSYIGLDGKLEVGVNIVFKDIPLTKVGVVENRINKIGRNLAKKFNTVFSPVKLK